MNKLRRFFATSGIYFAGSVFSKLISFFLLPLYTRRIPPDEFGTFDVAATVVSLTVPVMFLQIWDGMFRFAFEKDARGDKYGVISDSFATWSIGAMLYTVIFFAICAFTAFPCRLLTYIYGIVTAVQYQYAYIARAFRDNRLFVVSGLINSALNALVNIVLILCFNVGIESLYIAPVVGCAAQVIITEIALRPLSHIRLTSIKVKSLRQMLAFSVPLCISTILYWFFSGLTKLYISEKLGAYSNGLYAVACRFTSLLTFLTTAFQYAWNETAYLLAKDGDRFEKYRISVTAVFRLVMSGCAAFILLSKLAFPYLVGKAYGEAILIIPLALAGVAVNSFSAFVDTIFMAEKKTRKLLAATAAGAFVNLISTPFFTSFWKLPGAVGALALAYAALAVFRVCSLRRLFSFRLKAADTLYLLLPAAAFFIYFDCGTIVTVLSIVSLVFASLWGLREFLIPLFRRAAKATGRKIKYETE